MAGNLYIYIYIYIRRLLELATLALCDTCGMFV